jgi:hypothetical protein
MIAMTVSLVRKLQSASGDELPLALRFGDTLWVQCAARDALLPSVLDRAFKPLQDASRGEL